jgi:hypothetical protein
MFSFKLASVSYSQMSVCRAGSLTRLNASHTTGVSEGQPERVPESEKDGRRECWLAFMKASQTDGQCDGWLATIPPAATLRFPFPARGRGRKRRGRNVTRFRRLRRHRLTNFLPNCPPEFVWGRFEQKPTCFHQRTDQRSGMNGLRTPGPGVTVAGERLLLAMETAESAAKRKSCTWHRASLAPGLVSTPRSR